LYTREQIMDAVENCLDESERQVIMTRFGIEDEKTTTLTEIELKLGVSREQVREIERKVLSYIKEHY